MPIPDTIRSHHLRRLAAAALPLSLAVTLMVAPAAHAEPPGFTWPAGTVVSEQGMRSTTVYVPGTTNDGTHCTLAATLSAPETVDAAHPAPAVIIGHGYAQDRSSMIPLADLLVRSGYVTLAYDALGFGASTCGLGLADPDWDGAVMRSLVDVLGGKPGTSFEDAAATHPLDTIDFVVHDAPADGEQPPSFDPRVGVFGASYGGALAFALAAVDPRVDAIIPAATFHNLNYSIFPQGANTTDGISSPIAGIPKTTWGLGLTLGGQIVSVLQGLGIDPARATRCAFARASTCADLLAAVLRGYPDEAVRSYLDRISPEASIPRITAPVLLIQGEFDTLFTFNEALANFRELRQQGTTVRLAWAALGHNGGSPLEFDGSHPSPDQPAVARVLNWFGHWLKDDGSDLGAPFSVTKTWTPTPEAATSQDPDDFDKATFSLGASGVLGDRPAAPTALARTQTLLTNALALPTSLGHVDSSSIDVNGVYADYSVPGAQAYWQTAPLSTPMDVAGVPTITLQVSTPTASWRAQSSDLGQKITLYLKIYDVAPDGSRGVVGALSTPVRIDDTRQPFTANLQGIVHRFKPGHRIGFAVAGGDLNFRGGTTPAIVTIDAATAGQTLTLPVVR